VTPLASFESGKNDAALKTMKENHPTMRNRIEIVPYDLSQALPTAQAMLEVFSAPPFNEALTLNDTLALLKSDQARLGFNGVLIRLADTVVGFSWWYDITGHDLYDRWWSRFTPRENIPMPDGRGAFLTEFGVLPTLQHRGLGQRLLKASLDQIEPDHDWIALDTSKFAHAGLALLKSQAFEELELTGIQSPLRICLMKTIWRS
jgi:ribosomal protein S18 acetylase RimI-like enzyme